MEFDQNSLQYKLQESVQVMRHFLAGRAPRIGIILGSGLGPLADRMTQKSSIPFGDIPFMKRSTATSHVGQFVCGYLGSVEVLVMQGRLHGYEGNTAQEVAYPVWLMHELGIEILVTTNAAGALNETYRVGDFCVMADHLNFTGRNPLVGVDPDRLAPRFVSMADAYDKELRSVARQIAQQCDIPLHEGVYLGLLGPSFETPAEIRAFRVLGADTVAMSVVEEVIAARHVGMRVLGISLVSNMACGIDGASPSDEEVLQVAQTRENDFVLLMSKIISSI